jgi:hypothetical protein
VFIDAASKIKPLFLTAKDKVTFMNEWARNNAVAASSGMNFDTEQAKPAVRALNLTKPGSSLKKGGPIKPSGKTNF